MAKKMGGKLVSAVLVGGMIFSNAMVVNAQTQESSKDIQQKYNKESENNKPNISLKPGIDRIDLVKGSDVNLLSYVTATSSSGEDWSKYITLSTDANLNEVGTYSAWYSVTDPNDPYNWKNMFQTIHVVEPKPKNDWRDHWASQYIQTGIAMQWIKPTDQYRPDDFLTRAEAVTMFVRIYDLVGNDKKMNFEDVKPGHWYYKNVELALSSGLISDAKQFRPNDPVTREEFAVMMSNIETNKKGDTNHDKFSKYKDFNQASNWAKDGIEYTIERGYMGKGGQTFNPKDNITRAEAITALVRIM